MQDQEREAEHRERVLGPQLVAAGVHVELLGEARHLQRGQLPRLRVDVGQVVAGVLQRAAAGQGQAAVRAVAGSRVAVRSPCGTGKPTLT